MQGQGQCGRHCRWGRQQGLPAGSEAAVQDASPWVRGAAPWPQAETAWGPRLGWEGVGTQGARGHPPTPGVESGADNGPVLAEPQTSSGWAHFAAVPLLALLSVTPHRGLLGPPACLAHGTPSRLCWLNYSGAGSLTQITSLCLVEGPEPGRAQAGGGAPWPQPARGRGRGCRPVMCGTVGSIRWDACDLVHCSGLPGPPQGRRRTQGNRGWRLQRRPLPQESVKLQMWAAGAGQAVSHRAGDPGGCPGGDPGGCGVAVILIFERGRAFIHCPQLPTTARAGAGPWI